MGAIAGHVRKPVIAATVMGAASAMKGNAEEHLAWAWQRCKAAGIYHFATVSLVRSLRYASRSDCQKLDGSLTRFTQTRP